MVGDGVRQMMKLLIIALISLVCATSVKAAGSWTCSPNGTPTSVLYRFTLSPPDVIWSVREDVPFHIVRNDDIALVATSANPIGAQANRFFVRTIAINKVSGGFVLASVEVSEKDPDLVQHGKCLKD